MTALSQASRAALSDSENTQLALRVFRECERSNQELPAWIFPVLCERPTWPTVHRVDRRGKANGKVHMLYRCISHIKINSLCGAFGRMNQGPDVAIGQTKKLDSFSCLRCLTSRKIILPFYHFFPIQESWLIHGFVHLYPFRRISLSEPAKLDGILSEAVIVRTLKIKKKLHSVVGRDSLDPFFGIDICEELFSRRRIVLEAFIREAK